MKIKWAIGADHRGFKHKCFVMQKMQEIAWVDVGCNSEERTDFPVYAQFVANLIRKKEVEAGILLCGTGIGMAIAANRMAGIHAALVWSSEVSKQAKEHNNANIIVIPTDYVSFEETVQSIIAWKNACFVSSDIRYQKRIDMIDKIHKHNS